MMNKENDKTIIVRQEIKTDIFIRDYFGTLFQFNAEKGVFEKEEHESSYQGRFHLGIRNDEEVWVSRNFEHRKIYIVWYFRGDGWKTIIKICLTNEEADKALKEIGKQFATETGGKFFDFSKEEESK